MMHDAGASENSEKLIAGMKRTLENANSENTSMKRFKTVSEDEIKKFRDSWQTESTKRNTKWGVKIVQGNHFFFIIKYIPTTMAVHTCFNNRCSKNKPQMYQQNLL